MERDFFPLRLSLIRFEPIFDSENRVFMENVSLTIKGRYTFNSLKIY